MQTYRYDRRREQVRRLTLKRHEALVDARRRFAEAFSALSYGKPLDQGAPRAPGSFLLRVIFARRIARASAAAVVIAAAAALGGVAVVSPGIPSALLLVPWITGLLLYVAAESMSFRRGAERAPGAPDASMDILRAKAQGLDVASAALPTAGFLLTVILPLGWWMFRDEGTGALLIPLAAVSYAFFAWLRETILAERAQLSGR